MHTEQHFSNHPDYGYNLQGNSLLDSPGRAKHITKAVELQIDSMACRVSSGEESAYECQKKAMQEPFCSKPFLCFTRQVNLFLCCVDIGRMTVLML